MSLPPWAGLRPAYTNVHAVHAMTETVQVVLGHGFGPDAQVWHTAAVMGRSDARMLAESILKALAGESAPPPGRTN